MNDYSLLTERYPTLLTRDNGGGSVDFECGIGWFNILSVLMDRIQNHVERRQLARDLAIARNRMRAQALEGNWHLFDEYYKLYSEESRECRRRSLVDTADSVVPDIVPAVTVTQIKEKFGCLRFYYVGGDEYVDGLVTMAEEMSSVTCEQCGQQGSLRHKRWLKTQCDLHANNP